MEQKPDELRIKIESIRDRLANRIEQLRDFEEQYRDRGHIEDAAISLNKRRSLETVLRSIDEALL